MNLTALIQEGESETLEFKEQWNEKSLEAVASFVNTKGGTLLIGVKDNGAVIGWAGGDRDLQIVINQIVEILGVHPAISIQKERNKPIIVIEVKPGPTLVSCRGRYFHRVGNSTREIRRSTRPLFRRETWCTMGQRDQRIFSRSH